MLNSPDQREEPTQASYKITGNEKNGVTNLRELEVKTVINPNILTAAIVNGEGDQIQAEKRCSSAEYYLKWAFEQTRFKDNLATAPTSQVLAGIIEGCRTYTKNEIPYSENENISIGIINIVRDQAVIVVSGGMGAYIYRAETNTLEPIINRSWSGKKEEAKLKTQKNIQVFTRPIKPGDKVMLTNNGIGNLTTSEILETLDNPSSDLSKSLTAKSLEVSKQDQSRLAAGDKFQDMAAACIEIGGTALPKKIKPESITSLQEKWINISSGLPFSWNLDKNHRLELKVPVTSPEGKKTDLVLLIGDPSDILGKELGIKGTTDYIKWAIGNNELFQKSEGKKGFKSLRDNTPVTLSSQDPTIKARFPNLPEGINIEISLRGDLVTIKDLSENSSASILNRDIKN